MYGGFPKFENIGGIVFLVAPPPSPPSPPHANACTAHNFVTNTPIKFIFAIAIEVPDYKNPIFLASIGNTKWPLVAILYKNAQKPHGVSNCVINGGGDLFLWIINGTLLFLRKINLSLLFKKKINWRQLWKNNSILLSLWIIKRVYFL